MKEKEIGSASIFIDLTDSIIRVYHGESDTLLFEKQAFKGDWDKLWKEIKRKTRNNKEVE